MRKFEVHRKEILITKPDLVEYDRMYLNNDRTF